VTIGTEPGTVIDGRHEIVDKVGEGGFAVVYRAMQLSTKQEVALKHARPDVLRANESVHLERFKREVTLIGRMNHPNVVRVIDSGTIPVRRGSRPKPESFSTRIEGGSTQGDGLEEGTSTRTRRRQDALEGDGQATTHVPYIVMEFLRGESLSKLIDREEPLPPERAVDIILPIASALGAAHARGIVHRDVKPSNILLAEGPDGTIEPKMLDFGIAKLTEPDVQALTISTSLIGTPQCMSPEQARGLKDLDGRADQYSLAAVLYELLTGRRLYLGESLLELVAKALDAELMPLNWVRSDVPSGLPEVVAKALSRERDDRYESMKAFGQALVPFASPGTALRWAEAFGMDEERVSLVSRTGAHRASSGHVPTGEPSRRVKIALPDDASDPTDATVRFSLDELVESKNVAKAPSIDFEEPEATQAPAKEPTEEQKEAASEEGPEKDDASAKEPADEKEEAASDEAAKKDDAGAKEPADEKEEAASDEAAKKDDAGARVGRERAAGSAGAGPESEIPWAMIAVAIAVIAALLGKSFL
jgi:serine/threonine-protein kinase